MPKPESDILRRLAWPTYFVAFLLIATPALDYLSNVWPLRLGDVQWRYGSVGLLAGFVLTPLLGMMLALAAAAVLEHRGVVRVLSIVNLVLVPLWVIATLGFALDVLQLRATVPEEGRSTFDIGATKAAVKHLTMAVGVAWLGIAGLRATRSSEGGKRKRRMSEDVPLVRAEASPPRGPMGEQGKGGKGGKE